MDKDPTPSSLEPVVRHLLETSVQQAQLIQEMAQGLHMVTQELQTLQHTMTATAIPLPNPSQDTQHLLSKLTADNDVKAFLGIFVRVAIQKGWPQWYWTNALGSLLAGEAQQAYYASLSEDATD